MNYSVKLCRRETHINDSLPTDLSPLLRKLYLNRGIKHESELKRSVKDLLPWHSLYGIDSAILLLYHMLQEKHRIIVIGDFDADGATSTALTVLALRSMGGNIDYIIPNRFENGYGLSPELVEKARICGAKMILTVDTGITSYEGVDVSHQYGIPVLVTDHHLPGQELPRAKAIVNPNINNSSFPSRSLAGVGVAFYLMLALRAYLRKQNWFIKDREPNLAELLDLVALGTVADVVPLDVNNRILVWQGLNRIRVNKCRKGILAILEIVNRNSRELTTSDLGFIIAPILNAAGRLDSMSIGVELLLTDNIAHARILARKLHLLNQKRKKIEKNMRIKALFLCSKIERKYNKLPFGIAFYHPKWHQGIIGILASWLKDRFYRPVITFAPANDGIIKGSGRSIVNLHLYDLLDRLNTLYPGLIVKFGGHAMAVGLSLKEEKYEEFCQYFAEIVEQKLTNQIWQNIIWSDGKLDIKEFSLQTAEMLREAGPWGQSFPEPVFDGEFKLLQQRLLSDCHLKIVVQPIEGGPILNGIAFNIDPAFWPNSQIRQIKIAYKLSINYYRGNKSIQLIIDYIWPL